MDNNNNTDRFTNTDVIVIETKENKDDAEG